MKKILVLGITIAGIALLWRTGRPSAPVVIHSVLPTEAAAKALLNTTHRHREWVSVANVRAFIVYPERSDKAPVAVLSAGKQGASDWIRAVADQAAADGFIAVVPDVLSGLGAHGGDSNDFRNQTEVALAFGRMGRNEIVRRTNAVRDYAIALPAANGKSASLEFDGDAVRAAVAQHSASFKTADAGWAKAVSFLVTETGDKPVRGENLNVPEDHSMHIGMMMGQTVNDQKGLSPRGYPLGKLPDLPAGLFNAHTVVTNSKLRKEFVDIPFGSGKLHTWVEYPEGSGKAPIVIVMQHGPGLDNWQRALADQLAQQGFIAIAADLHSGLGPNGGNYDSFQGTDDVMRASARLTADDMFNRYKAARDWGMKLPRANGKSASIGFCMGGGNSFRFASEIPDLNAAVVFYGTPANQEMLTKIKAPVLAFYGEDDARVTATMAPTEATMKAAGKSFEAHSYTHGTHGFLEFQDLGGNPAAVSDSWPRTIAFLKEHTS
ncbi:MAG: dienelactone hydrolase family protein [Acidobacteriota bacterium]|nr:dienelactone hydrolase family protein [Acidobacteriota bacterium]